MRHRPDYGIVDGRHGCTGAELRAWREAHRVDGVPMTQREAGMLFGLSRVHWGCMERGVRPVSRVLAHLVRQWRGREGER